MRAADLPPPRPEELERLNELLRVPSISARPDHSRDMVRAAELCAQEIRLAGGTAEVLPGEMHPLVVGDVPPTTSSDTRVLVYGHYDVQAPEPLDAWETPPFEPTVRDGYLYARGTSDDKGHLFMLFRAVQALVSASVLPVHVSFVIDGEEETGGTSAVDYISRDPQPAAAAIIFDAPMIGSEQPAFYTGLRGLTMMRVHVRTGRSEAHSGLYGGAAMNAAHVLIDLLHAVLPRNGRVAERLAAGVAPVTDEEVATWDLLPRGGDALRGPGLNPVDGSAEEEFYLRTLALPALDVHGLRAGPDEMDQAIVPATAEATLSVRLGPGQHADEIGATLAELLREAAPDAATVTLDARASADPALIDPRNPCLTRAAKAVEEAIGWRPVPARIGGSIPVVAAISARGIPTILSGFYLPDDGIHAPNERIRMEHLTLGTRAAAAILSALGPEDAHGPA